MAQNDKNATKTKSDYTQGKRLARAKVKRPETEEERKKKEADRKKTIRNVAVSIFAVILVLSMMIPSLASIVAGARQARNSKATQEVTSEQIDEMYSSSVEELEAALAENPKDLETLNSLGNQYMSWGYMLGAYVSDETSAERSVEMLTKAKDYYDQYLAIEASPDVSVDRALCLLYTGDTEGAQTSLEAVVKDTPDCASAWANLGLIYETTNPDAAAMAYQRALDVDPEDTYQVASFAQSRLDALNEAANAEAATDGEAITVDVSDEGGEAAESTEGAESAAETSGSQTEASGKSN